MTKNEREISDGLAGTFRRVGRRFGGAYTELVRRDFVPDYTQLNRQMRRKRLTPDYMLSADETSNAG